MGTMLDSDILYSIVAEVADPTAHDVQDLRNISLASRLLRAMALPVLFTEVRWPHPDKHSEENGLEFFPKTLWRHFRKLSLLWPDHWPDSSPPLWGDRYYIGGDYHPRHMNKLVDALPRMEGLSKLHISCPFYPPSSIFTALVQCPSIRSLSISDTPLYMSMIPRVPSDFHLEHLSLVPVGQALRVGEGPYDSKYQDLAYYIRDYRKKYRNDSLVRYAADALLYNFAKASSLRSVQVSGDMCTLHDLARHDWPELQILILTGHAPRPYNGVDLIDVVARMPKLADLRLLFATVKNDPLFPILPCQTSSEVAHETLSGNPATLLSQIRHLALSNACQLSGVIFHYANQLERLVICAISDLPRVPIALSRAEINALINDLGTPPTLTTSDTSASGVLSGSASMPALQSLSSGSPAAGVSSSSSSSTTLPYPSLKLLRIMIEDKANPELCHKICELFPHLEVLEVELCGYHDGKSIHAWDEFVSAFTPLSRLRRLRLCIQFPEFDETDRVEPWRNARRECAAYFAERLPSLECVGFEYRKRTGTHRYEDSWLEYEVERQNDGVLVSVLEGRGSPYSAQPAQEDVVPHHHHGRGLRSGPGCQDHLAAAMNASRVSRLVELPSSWYRFPEVWTPEYITT